MLDQLLPLKDVRHLDVSNPLLHLACLWGGGTSCRATRGRELFTWCVGLRIWTCTHRQNARLYKHRHKNAINV